MYMYYVSICINPYGDSDIAERLCCAGGYGFWKLAPRNQQSTPCPAI